MATLQEYIDRGEKIVRTGNYNNSIMKKVDEFVHNPSDFFESNRELLKWPNIEVGFDKTFVALAAPSLEGKTQTAFTLRSANPLYFPLTAAQRGESSGQAIYDSFTSHAAALFRFAKKDIDAIKFVATSERPGPSAGFINQFKAQPLFVLGFLAEIMKQTAAERRRRAISSPAPVSPQSSHSQDAAADAVPLQLPNWMNFYTSGLTEFVCHTISIEEFIELKETIEEPFCVFLDEFFSDDWTLYVRNLSRLVGLTCIVSNTNTKVANLVTKGVDESRDDADVLNTWSIVFRRLDNIDKEVIDLTPRASLLRSYCKSSISESPEFERVFKALFDDWFYKTRPGIGVWMTEAIDELLASLRGESSPAVDYFAEQAKQGSFSRGKALTLGSFLQFIAARVAKKLSSRKSLMVSRLNGQVGKLGILTDAAYCDSSFDLEAKAETFKFIQFLETHLYYLVNPTNSALDYFLTFRPDGEDEHLRLIWQESKLNNGVLITETVSEMWGNQLTAFREDELFTILTCLFVELKRSSNLILHHAKRRNMISNMRIAELLNINAIKLSGNHLEVAAAMACADASHHTNFATSPHGLQFSLHGQNGMDWINNIVSNCSFSKFFRSVHLQVVDVRLKNWLTSSVHIPFLYGINKVNPMLELLSAVPETGIFASSYRRTRDIEGIDGHFEYLERDRNGAWHVKECAIECKNLTNSLGAAEIHELVENALFGEKSHDPQYQGRHAAIPKLFLIFTNDVREPQGVSNLKTLCEEHIINLYRISRVLRGRNAGRLQLNRHKREWKIFSEPQSVGILIEIDAIIEN